MNQLSNRHSTIDRIHNTISRCNQYLNFLELSSNHYYSSSTCKLFNYYDGIILLYPTTMYFHSTV